MVWDNQYLPVIDILDYLTYYIGKITKLVIFSIILFFAIIFMFDCVCVGGE